MVVFKRTNIRILNDKIKALDQNKDGQVDTSEIKIEMSQLPKQRKDRTIGKGINEMAKQDKIDLVQFSKQKKIPFINTLALTKCKVSNML